MKTRATGACVAVATTILSVGLAGPAIAASSSNPELVGGSVKSSTGTGVAGASVLLIAEPTGVQLHALKKGQTSNALVVAITKTDASGAYSFPSPDASSLSDKVDQGGNVQFSVVTWPTQAASSVYAFGRSYSKATNTLTAPRIADAQAGSAATAGDSAPVQADLVVPDSSVPIVTRNLAAPDAAASPDSFSCKATNEGSKNADTSLAKFCSTVDGGKGSPTYDSTASSKLGVAVSSNGSSWQASGTSDASNTLSTSESAGSKTGHFNTAANSYFEFIKTKEVCTDLEGGATSTTWQTRESQYNGGLHYGSLSSYPSTPYCEPVSNGYSISKSTSTASTFSGGVSISDLIGINLSSQSGYSSKVKVTLSLSDLGFGPYLWDG